MKMIIMKEPLILSLLRFRDSHARPSRAQRDRMCVCVCVYVFVSVWPSGCHCATDFTSKRCLFIYLCIQLFTFFSALATCPCLQQKAAALCGHFTVRWSGFVSVLRLCVSVGEGDVKGPWPRLRF